MDNVIRHALLQRVARKAHQISYSGLYARIISMQESRRGGGASGDTGISDHMIKNLKRTCLHRGEEIKQQDEGALLEFAAPERKKERKESRKPSGKLLLRRDKGKTQTRTRIRLFLGVEMKKGGKTRGHG